MARRTRLTVGCVEQDDWSCHGPRADFAGGGAGQAKGSGAPELAGLAENLAVRAVATAVGVGPGQVAASVRETGDLGQAAERVLRARAGWRQILLLVLPLLTWLIQLLNTAVCWAAMSRGHAGRDLG